MRLAVTGGKGGVGKSTVAYNLGAATGAVVVDGDLGMADLPATRGPDLHDVLAGRADPVEAVREDGPVRLLPCGRSLAGARAADATELVRAVAAVEHAYGDVILDCPAGMAADAGIPLLVADRSVLVALPDAFALPDALRTRALARELDAGLARVVLNRTGENPPVAAVERALGAPVSTIPEKEVVRRAGRAGQPVQALAPDGPVVDAFESLAAAVAPRS
ncbi:MinD/ParA family ATP-binding protein [Haloarchaeobius amylolyticus]|uniref:MinD/ParA family ATP-binding protein n=1 Tax=Haloarchaeobius amylolyticus TaxID=1198296 RepID=UPI00226DF7D0|nr:MinD/ParA family protein [Haloarchaeobius amylolyticus]